MTKRNTENTYQVCFGRSNELLKKLTELRGLLNNMPWSAMIRSLCRLAILGKNLEDVASNIKELN